MSLIHEFKENEEYCTFSLTVLSGVFLFVSFFGLLPVFPIDPAWVAIISGIPIVFGAIKGLVTEFDVTADVLAAIALVAAVVIGQYFAAGEVAFIMQLGKVLEEYTAGKSHKSLQSLIKLTPQYACIRTGNLVTGALVHNIGSVFVVVNSALLLTYNEEGHTTI